jgi:hypothetical protein
MLALHSASSETIAGARVVILCLAWWHSHSVARLGYPMAGGGVLVVSLDFGIGIEAGAGLMVTFSNTSKRVPNGWWRC